MAQTVATSPETTADASTAGPDTASAEPAGPEAPPPKDVEGLLDAASDEARVSAVRLRDDFLALLPKLLVAVGVFVVAWLLVRLVRFIFRGLSMGWERAAAFRSMIGIGIWIIATGVAASVLAGDVRALVGSLGLVGLALSWALQTPIESFTGWILNSFRGYYRVGDRIAVGDIHGEVYRIDFLNTTLWEIGSPGRDDRYVKAEQPTGRLITFPNSEVLAGSIINFTRDFPWVWDEYELAIANESDLQYALTTVREIADGVLAESMAGPAKQYENILREARLERSVTPHPEVFVATNDWATLLIIRYLVNARERRVWKSRLITALATTLADPRHASRIIPVYPRRQLQTIGSDGVAREPETDA